MGWLLAAVGFGVGLAIVVGVVATVVATIGGVVVMVVGAATEGDSCVGTAIGRFAGGGFVTLGAVAAAVAVPESANAPDMFNGVAVLPELFCGAGDGAGNFTIGALLVCFADCVADCFADCLVELLIVAVWAGRVDPFGLGGVANAEAELTKTKLSVSANE